MRPRGIREVPQGVSEEVRGFLEDVRENILSLRTNQAPLAGPTNFNVTPMPFGNTVQWTRSVDADYYEIWWNTSPSLNGAQTQGVGDSGQYIDTVGKDGVTRYYWVRARKYNGASSVIVGPKSGTTLAATPGVTPPTPPPPSHILVVDTGTGRSVYYVPFGGAGGGVGQKSGRGGPNSD